MAAVAVTQSLNHPVAPSRAAWRMWIPCLGMALCTWLSFVDRQVLGSLTPTILRETGMSAKDFADVNGYFALLAYALANPVWGSILDSIGLRAGMLMAVGLWTAASMSHAGMTTILGFSLARGLLGFGEGATFPWRHVARPSNRCHRSAAAARSRCRFPAARSAASPRRLIRRPGASRCTAWLARGVHLHGRPWPAVARHLVVHRAAAISRPRRAEGEEARVAESARAPLLGAGLELRAAGDCARTDSRRHPARSERQRVRRRPKRQQAGLGHILWAPPLAWGLGHAGDGADSHAHRQPRHSSDVPAADGLLSRVRLHDEDVVGRAMMLIIRGRACRRRIPDGRAQSRRLHVFTRAGGADVRHRVGSGRS